MGRAQAYQDLGLPTDPQEFLAKITASLDQAARAAADGLARNRFAAVHNGRLKLKRTDALPISPELRQLREAFQASYPRVRIEDLLQDVDEWCGFTRAFQPLAGYQSRAKDHQRSLLATLIAHGTNLGLAAMSQSVDTVTAEALQDTSRWFLREATLKAANTILVDYHHSLPFSRIWGDGSRSSSDGQRFPVSGKSITAAHLSRYFARGAGVSTYTAVSDQHATFDTKVIAATVPEAPYMLKKLEVKVRRRCSWTSGGNRLAAVRKEGQQRFQEYRPPSEWWLVSLL